MKDEAVKRLQDQLKELQARANALEALSVTLASVALPALHLEALLKTVREDAMKRADREDLPSVRVETSVAVNELISTLSEDLARRQPKQA